MQAVVRAPELNRPNLEWLNCDHPISLRDLEGKFVILDFWTYCCVNCQHVLPILKKIEDAFPEEVVVIGVHSPKFTAEKDVTKLQAAIERHNIRHPIIQDTEMTLWKEYAIRAWPTLVFLSPDGHIIGQCPGEPDANELIRAINATLDDFKMLGTLFPEKNHFAKLNPPTETNLSFPTKIRPVQFNGERHFAVADHGHNQIVFYSEDGTEAMRFGSGEASLTDGDPTTACFNAPNGMIYAEKENALYIADTSNHAIRRLDLTSLITTTIAGTGQRGHLLKEDGIFGKDVSLASPWDVALQEDWVVFTNAGTHQIGSIAPDGKVRLFAGSGVEGIQDGKAESCQFAQPSSIIISEKGSLIFIIDAETSALRAINIATKDVKTLIGKGLFDFGHKNGPFGSARLQHPLDVSFFKGDNLLIADSYNDFVKRSNLVDGSITTFAKEWDCSGNICQNFAEPSGLYSDGQDVYVCDTNNHRIVKFDETSNKWHIWVA